MSCSSAFHVDLVLESDRTRMRCAGDLDLSTTPHLVRALKALLAQAPLDVELDFSAVRCLDSTAISALIEARRQFQARRGHLYIGRSNPRIDRVLTVLRLQRLTTA